MTDGSTGIWTLPGYDVQALVGFGATGEVWAARAVATGEVVALKRLRDGTDPAAVEALRREAAVLRTLDIPYVVRLREVVGEGVGTVLVLDHAGGGSLAALLSRRGSLDPGEVVTVAAPLAQALAAAHARGLVHGDVSSANVLFTADGMPLLADLGTARLAGEQPADVDATAEYLDPAVAAGGEPGPASDVWALAAVCHHMLSGSPPHEGESVSEVLTAVGAGARAPLGLLAPRAPRVLVAAVEAALARDPAGRPDAAAFAASLQRSHAAAPVLLSGRPAAGPVPVVRETHAVPRHAAAAPESSGRPALPGWLLPVAAAVVLVVAAATVGWLSGGSPEPLPGLAPLASAAPSPGPSAEPSSDPVPSAGATPADVAPDWSEVLDELDAARAQAFADGDAGALTGVYAPGSPGLAADRALVSAVVEAGQTARGVRHTVRSVQEQERTDATARLRVVDVLDAYELVDSAGAMVGRVPSRGDAPYLVELTRTPDGWRLVQVQPA